MSNGSSLPPTAQSDLQDRPQRKFLRELLRDTIQTKFFRQGVQVGSWRIVSLLCSSAASVWAARCLGPENLGISTMIVATITQLGLLVTLNQTSGYVRYYSRQSDQPRRDEVLATVFTYRATMALILMSVAIPLVLALHFPPRWWLGLTAALPLFFFTVNQPDWALQAQEKLPDNYRAVSFQYATLAILYVIFFRPGMGPGSDVAVQVVSGSIYFAVGWYLACRGRSVRLWQWHLLPRIWVILKENIWLILIGVLIYISVSLEQPLIGYLYSLKELGIYRASTTVLNGVQSFLVLIPGLLLPRLLQWSKQGPHYLWARQMKIALVLAGVLIPLWIVGMLVSPLFFHLAYGPRFDRASFPFTMLFLAKIMAVLSGVFNYGLLALKQDRTIFGIHLTVALFSLTFNLLLIPRLGGYGAATVNCLSETLVLVLAIVCCHRLCRTMAPPPESLHLPVSVESSV
jgi:O-antigen/teichoic acid export membrane protein